MNIHQNYEDSAGKRNGFVFTSEFGEVTALSSEVHRNGDGHDMWPNEGQQDLDINSVGDSRSSVNCFNNTECYEWSLKGKTLAARAVNSKANTSDEKYIIANGKELGEDISLGVGVPPKEERVSQSNVTSGKKTSGISTERKQYNGLDSRDEDTSKRTSFMKRIFDLMIEEGINKTLDPNSKVVEFRQPRDLQYSLDLTIPAEGVSEDRLLELCRDTINYSVRIGHPHFFNQLYGGFDRYGLAGAWLTETLNPSLYTYEVSPVFTLMEKEIIQHMASKIGFTEWDGIFCPGGSMSNLNAMNLGRYHKFPIVKKKGVQHLPPICLMTSEQCHYSISKSAAALGIGTDHVIPIKCDARGSMDALALEEAVLSAKAMGMQPFFVNATAGSTVLGAYDPIDAIADVCLRHDMWLHTDCCWGGGALLSRKHKHLLQGIHRSDSVAWNPHKLMGVPLQCCALITSHPTVLADCHQEKAMYLFQPDKYYDSTFDAGDKSLQCSRKVDVLKVWLMWKAHGDHGFEKIIDRSFDNSRYLLNRLQDTKGFRVVVDQPMCTNVCFWYIPPALRGQIEDKQWWNKLHKVAPLIKERMMVAGTLMITYQRLGHLVNFFRMVVINPAVTHTDMDFVLDEIHRLGADIQI